MPWGEIKLIPGVNVEKTPTLNEAGVSQSQLIRYKDSLIQKYGGWTPYYPFPVATVPRDLHGWDDLNGKPHLAIGSTNGLLIDSSGVLSTITPQTLVSDFSPNFSTVMNSATVTIVDPNIANVTTYDAVYFNTPVAVGGLILSGLYPIASITGTHSYTITAAAVAPNTVNNGGAVPVFTAASSSATVEVTLNAHGLVVGNHMVFPIATTGQGVTILGLYTVTNVVDANNFDITVTNQATGSGSFDMNGGNAELVYYLNLGPTLSGQGYGLGNYGAGLYGYGIAGGSAQTGTPITATDWTSVNWGQILLACPQGGGIYQFDPTGGFINAGLVATAPPFNNGIFISNAQQILVAWGSTVSENLGVIQDPMWVQWSTLGDYTDWVPTATNEAGGFRIPIGSRIMTGAAVANQDLLWTDLDLWAMNFLGAGEIVFGFNQIGIGAGAISSHAVQGLRGNVYWMGNNNFYSYTSNGAAVLPCPVWDFVFQNINPNFTQNVRSMPNTPFNEAGWLFPSLASTSGECDSYVKMNITEPNASWDYGSISRSAWIDQGALGMPISATPQGNIYQQEMTNDAAGAALNASFTTGYFMIGKGEDFVFVDQIIPDMKWGFYPGSGGATVLFTFYVVAWPGDAPAMYGPYSVNENTEYISVRFRGRQMAIQVQSLDVGSFWRLGRIRYRFGPSGRR